MGVSRKEFLYDFEMWEIEPLLKAFDDEMEDRSSRTRKVSFVVASGIGFKDKHMTEYKFMP